MNTPEQFYRPVGDRFKFRDVELEVKATCRCDGCYFFENDHHHGKCAQLQSLDRFTREEIESVGHCSVDFRADNESVIFMLVKE